ncbi:ATP-binding cassette domain-containing protein [Membranihabitans maritimus]|uniref:ATP-binding cassette domain-containing protein n=1 Tax=Membranihabitans maritimus TaxID=2904244 RepID=UPI001F02276F|nr:ATP-binding cassette domain-containing protein [Membranihabitans maritimus]
MGIQVQNISKSFGTQTAVQNLTFSAINGEILGFLGPNGAGKTTSLRMIAGHLIPDSGNILYDGIDIWQNPVEAKQMIGYLPESNPLYYDLYVKEILGFYARLHHIPNSKNRIEDVIEMVGLNKEQKKKVGNLSKGYKQRVGVAVAILHDPEILLLDEPVSGLDPNQLADISELIRNLAKTKTVIYSSHILSEVEKTCDKVLIISDGELKVIDRLDVLKAKSVNSQIIWATFDVKIDGKLLRRIEGIKNATCIAGNTWKIEAVPNVDIRRNLYDWTVVNNAPLLESKVEESTMASVFKELTKE